MILLGCIVLTAYIGYYASNSDSHINQYSHYYSDKIATAVKYSQPARWLRNTFTDTPASHFSTWDGIAPPVPGSTKISELDGMLSIYIPAGEFLMGSDDEHALPLEKPQRTFSMDAYWIDSIPVTNKMYQQCMDAGVCGNPASIYEQFDDPAYADNPVVFITWFQADEYCHWVGGKLPGEAQWDYAARGSDGRLYPWGNTEPNQYLLNYKDIIGFTSPAGSYPDGASPFGVLDMAGNVREWTDDWFSETFFLDAPDANPSGPAEGEYKVLKGGGYSDPREIVRLTTRCFHDPISPGANRGFRCVR